MCFKSQLCVSGNKSQREELDSILFIFEVSHLDFIVLSRVSPDSQVRWTLDSDMGVTPLGFCRTRFGKDVRV